MAGLATPAGDLSPRPRTRREFLRLVNLGLAAAAAGCVSSEPARRDTASLPEPEPPAMEPHEPAASPALADSGYAPPANFAPPPSSLPLAEPARAPSNFNAVISRATWTKAGPAKPCAAMGGVGLLTFHHDGDPSPYTDDSFAGTARYLERIRAYHVHEGFQDIGYHYAIDRAGRVWELRSTSFRGEHVRPGYDARGVLHKWNDHNVGVVVLGNFMLQTPTAAQQRKICEFGHALRQQYRLAIAQVKVHQELVTTECPGVHMRPYLDQVRARQLI
ncbi:MAG TPA: N-acetylmuramoyl-L-alanine amidase [Opitutales bacterium]|nr:N-acetylmuramoyl-L-alanine amidase [Opitutales bacterium]